MSRTIWISSAIAAAAMLAFPGEAASQPNLSSVLPELAPEGWSLFDDTVLTFTAENLYEQINGRAEFYLAYDVVAMTFASYEKGGQAGQFIDVSVYDMGTPSHAFGVFAGERTFEAPPLELGRESYRSGANYYIWRGQYYIQLIASDTTDDLQRLGLRIGTEVAGVLPDDGEAVWGLDALPQQDRVPGSEQFFLVDAMALDFMLNTYTAKYTKSGVVLTAFLSRRDNTESARAALNSYIDYGERYGDAVERLAVDGVQLIACNMGDGYDVAFRKGALVGGVIGVDDRNLAIQAAVELYSQIEVQR